MMGSIQNASDAQTSDTNRPASEENIARLCRIGQELVHEIVHKAADIFHVLKTPQVSPAYVYHYNYNIL